MDIVPNTYPEWKECLMNIKMNREWYWFDGFILGMRFVWYVSSIFNVVEFSRSPDQIAVPALLLTIAFIVPQLFFQPWCYQPSKYIILELLVTGSLYLYLLTFNPAAISLYTIPVLVIGYLTNKQNMIWSLSSLVILLILPIFIVNPSVEMMAAVYSNFIVLYGIGYCFNFFINANFKMKHLLSIIEEKNKTLEQYSLQIEKMAVLEERSRMAKELHDTVGHTFTASIVGMEAIKSLIDKDPENAKKRLKDLIGFSRKSLDEVRKSIHAMSLHDSNKSLINVLKTVAGDFSMQTGTHVQFETDGPVIEVSDHVKMTLLRCLQECLTNAKKHGDASHIKINLAFEGKDISLKINDNGKGAEQLTHGFGLRSMEERLRSCNGTIRIHSKAGEGTMVSCKISMGWTI